MKLVALLSVAGLLLSGASANSILDEGISYFRRNLDQSEAVGVSINTTPADVPLNAPVPGPIGRTTQASAPAGQTVAPPPPMMMMYPPPSAMTNRALIYNSPINLGPGEFITYTPLNQFDITGVPPSISGPIESVIDGFAPARNAPPAAQRVFSEIGPAITQIPRPARQTFVNLLTPDVKSLPTVSQAITQDGLQGVTTPSTASTPAPRAPSSAPATFKVALSLISLFVSVFYILF